MGTKETFAGTRPAITETALERKALAGFRALTLDGQARALSLIDRISEAEVRKLAARGALAVGAAIGLAACAGQPLNQDTLRLHAERNCRVKAKVDKTYAVQPDGSASIGSVTYVACMRRAGFPVGGAK